MACGPAVRAETIAVDGVPPYLCSTKFTKEAPKGLGASHGPSTYVEIAPISTAVRRKKEAYHQGAPASNETGPDKQIAYTRSWNLKSADWIAQVLSASRRRVPKCERTQRCQSLTRHHLILLMAGIPSRGLGPTTPWQRSRANRQTCWWRRRW